MRVYRSIARPKAIEPGHVDRFYWDNGHQTITVHEDDTPRDTGLLDAYGNPIMAFNVTAPIGFGRN